MHRLGGRIFSRRGMIAINLVLIVVFALLKIYVAVYETGFHDLNIRNIQVVREKIAARKSFSFAVVGNVKNSIDIFDRRLMPRIKAGSYDFVIFAGNSVMDGAHDKFGAFYRTLKKLEIPGILAVGDSEMEDFGAKKFYHYFGPYFFSFAVADSYFIFLDTTGQTSEEWQRAWVQRQLQAAAAYHYKFVVMNRSPACERSRRRQLLFHRYRMSAAYVDFLQTAFSRARVTAVFSASRRFYEHRVVAGVPYYATGGGGGELPLRVPVDFHFLAVRVMPGGVQIDKVTLPEKNRSLLPQFWKSLWFQIHSWFYVAWINFFLGLALIWLILFTLYTKLAEQVDYYPPLSREPPASRKLTIVMFTNNYFPFVGGVPIAISRLKMGLEKLGHRVYIFAPRYDRRGEDEPRVIRCRPLFRYRRGSFVVPVTNIFSINIGREFKRLEPDIVHLHHPYWLGSVGQKLARRRGIGTVYTYHTRLERLNHYLPLFRGLAGGRVPHMLIKHFANHCDAIVAPTMTAKSYLRNLGVGKTIEVLPTGVDLDAYDYDAGVVAARRAELGGGRLVLISVFRLSAEKNPYFFLEGISRLRQLTTVPFCCVIAGDGPEREKMAARIATLGLEDEVRLLGNVPPAEIALYYLAADLFVFASQAETQGLVVLEAMAGGCPVVAVEASGVTDVVHPGRNGLLTGASTADWSAGIAALLNDDARRRQLGEQAREDARHYSLEAMAAKMVALYDQVRWLKAGGNGEGE